MPLKDNKKIKDFYIKIFLSTCLENSQEAKENAKLSWKLLGPDEKRVIEEKFKIYDSLCHRNIAKSLKSEEFYRKQRRTCEESKTVQLVSTGLEPVCEQQSQFALNECLEARSPSITRRDSCSTLVQYPQHSVHSDHTLILDHTFTLPEEPATEVGDRISSAEETPEVKEELGPLGPPVPPPVRFGKHLYCMVTGNQIADWKKLSPREKGPYLRAISLIKKEYLTRYTRYLHSLTDAQLYSHKSQVTYEDEV